MKRALLALAATLTVALAMTGCSSSEPSAGSSTETPAGSESSPASPATETPAPSSTPEPSESGSDVEADTRDFFILGNGAGPLLLESNWGATVTEAHQLTKSETANEYSITLDLYAGDEFQLAIDSTWADQKGAGYLTETEVDGEAVFEDANSAGLTSDPYKANIKVAKDGNYTLTLTTNPADPTADTITWVRNGDAEEAVDYAAMKLYVRGNLITDWQFSDDKAYEMTSFLNGVFTYEAELFAGDDIVFYNFADDGRGPGNVHVNASAIDTESSDVEALDLENAKGNIGIKEHGTYSFEYDARTNVLVVTFDPTTTKTYEPGQDWFIAGSGSSALMMTSGWGKSGGFESIQDEYRLRPTGTDYEYSITLDLAKGDQFTIVSNPLWGQKHSFSYLDSPEKDGTANFTEAENIRVAVGGNYTLTLVQDPERFSDDRITWVRNGDQKEPNSGPFTVFMKGANTGWELTEPVTTEDGVATFNAEFAAEDTFTFLFFAEGTTSEDIDMQNPGSSILGAEIGTTGGANASFGSKGNDFQALEAGSYDITVDFSGGGPVVDFEKAG